MYLTVFCAFLAVSAAATQPAGDPDALYRDRDTIASARQAVAIWDARAQAKPLDFEAWWKIARACYWLGGQLAHGVFAGGRQVA